MLGFVYIITSASQIAPSVRSQLKGRITARNKEVDVGPLSQGQTAEAEVMCPAGSPLTGGGGQALGKLAITGTIPAGMGRGWAIEAQSTRTGGRGRIIVFAFCQA